MSSIGLFDSGIGGLSVLKVLRHRFPRENFLYVADSAYRPYGEKTEDQIYSRSHSIIKWMRDQGVKLVVVACHTSSSVLKDANFSVPCISMMSPSLESIFSRTYTRGVGIIATLLSVSKGTLAKQLIQRGFPYPVHARACPELVPLIESQQLNRAKEYLCHHLQHLRTQGVDHILYGCTHYPFLDSLLDLDIRSQMIDPAHHVADLIEDMLNKGEVPHTIDGQGHLALYDTGEGHTLRSHVQHLGWWGQDHTCQKLLEIG